MTKLNESAIECLKSGDWELPAPGPSLSAAPIAGGALLGAAVGGLPAAAYGAIFPHQGKTRLRSALTNFLVGGGAGAALGGAAGAGFGFGRNDYADEAMRGMPIKFMPGFGRFHQNNPGMFTE